MSKRGMNTVSVCGDGETEIMQLRAEYVVNTCVHCGVLSRPSQVWEVNFSMLPDPFCHPYVSSLLMVSSHCSWGWCIYSAEWSAHTPNLVSRYGECCAVFLVLN